MICTQYVILLFTVVSLKVIPGLSAFCIDAALGILALFILQSTFFVACLTLDQKRIAARRDAILCCLAYKSSEPNKCSQKNFLALAFENYIGPFLMKTPSKVGTRSMETLLRKKNNFKFYMLNCSVFSLIMASIFVKPVLVQ